jgi:hypothetical protein
VRLGGPGTRAQPGSGHGRPRFHLVPPGSTWFHLVPPSSHCASRALPPSLAPPAPPHPRGSAHSKAQCLADLKKMNIELLKCALHDMPHAPNYLDLYCNDYLHMNLMGTFPVPPPVPSLGRRFPLSTRFPRGRGRPHLAGAGGVVLPLALPCQGGGADAAPPRPPWARQRCELSPAGRPGRRGSVSGRSWAPRLMRWRSSSCTRPRKRACATPGACGRAFHSLPQCV